MCKPLFMQALSLRAQLDPEYLGVRLDPPSGESAMLPSDVPGEEKNGNGSFPSASSPIEDDLQIIGAPYHLLHRYRQMAGERQSQIMAFRKWKRRLQWRIESPYQLRAMAIAYCIDDRRIRTVLEAADELWSLGRSLADDSRLESPPKNRSLLKRTYRTITLKQHRTKKRAEMLLSHPLFRKLDLTKESEKAFLRSILARSNHYSPLLKTVLDVKAKGKQYEQVSIPLDRALESLLQIGSDPEPSMRQLTVLRTVQTLSVLDLDNYVSLVSELGQYATHEET
jgi:hypothetical protein